MAEPMKSRVAIDLDDLERQLRDTASTQPKAAPADPLAELARIVGQDDPFKALFADKPAARPTPVSANRPSPMPPPAQPLHAQQAVSQPASLPAAAPAVTGAAARVEPSIDDLLREFDLAMEKADPALRKTSAASAASAPTAPGSGPAVPSPASASPLSAKVEPSMPSDTMVDAFDALLRDELRADVEPTAQSRATRSSRQVQFDPEDLDRADPDSSHINVRDLDRDTGRADINAADRDLDDDLPPADYPEPPAEPVEDMRSLEPQQPRKGLMIAAGLMGIAALGIGAVVGLGGLFGGSSGPSPGGEVPIVRAESGPAKVQPANPGGVDIPNQNKQIFERAGEAKPADTRVVNREEQPMDVQAAARQAARVILPAPGADAASATPPATQPDATQLPPGTPIAPGIAAAPPAQGNGQTASLAPPQATIQSAQPPALGEPRRVRTVSVRPDGTIAPPPGAPETGSGPAAAPASPPPVAPSRAATPPSAANSAPVVRTPQPPAPPRQPAETPRQQVAAAPATPPVAAPAAPRTGGVMVQLAAPGSEAEARATFSALQRRHSAQLAGETPVIRRAESNGRTVYRLRIGPYASREEAAAKCEAIRADGGQCFLATN